MSPRVRELEIIDLCREVVSIRESISRHKCFKFLEDEEWEPDVPLNALLSHLREKMVDLQVLLTDHLDHDLIRDRRAELKIREESE